MVSEHLLHESGFNSFFPLSLITISSSFFLSLLPSSLPPSPLFLPPSPLFLPPSLPTTLHSLPASLLSLPASLPSFPPFPLSSLPAFLPSLQASCNPVAYSLIADFFPARHRAFALSVYHYGVYLGMNTMLIEITIIVSP